MLTILEIAQQISADARSRIQLGQASNDVSREAVNRSIAKIKRSIVTMEQSQATLWELGNPGLTSPDYAALCTLFDGNNGSSNPNKSSD